MNHPIERIPAGTLPAIRQDNPFQQMATALIDKGGDVSQLGALLDLQMKWEGDQARKAYADSMASAQAEMPAIFKDKFNLQTESWYATLESVNNRITPVYTKHGFSLSFDTEDSPLEKCIRIVCRVLHYKGHREEFRYDQPIDDVGIGGKVNKTQVHARGSAITYGRRYLTMMIFNLVTGDEDDDGNTATSERVNVAEAAAADKEAAKLAAFKEAHGRLSESVKFIQDRMDAGDFKAAAEEWYQFSQKDQMALFLAPTKGGCFTTKQREQMKAEFGKFNTKKDEGNGN